ncbi:MAG: head-tail connector protein [Desulfitobacteriaceae bacterium]
MTYQTLNCTLNDRLADATNVVLGSADGSYGIKNLVNGTPVVLNNTPVIHYNTGIYKYDVSALTPGIQYQVSWQITYPGAVHYATALFTLGTAPQLSDVKTYLRIDSSDTSFDVEIQDMINAAQTDLIEVGVNPDVFNSSDPLIRKAITTYCKANFGYDADNAPAFASSYEKLKIFLMNCADYQPLVVDLGGL